MIYFPKNISENWNDLLFLEKEYNRYLSDSFFYIKIYQIGYYNDNKRKHIVDFDLFKNNKKIKWKYIIPYEEIYSINKLKGKKIIELL